jgi:hypothetical protein
LNPEALQLAQRKNIKSTAYVKLQQRTRELNISSFTELIWPLPGETTASFRGGIQELCRAGDSVIIVYPHYLLVNTPLFDQRERHRLVTRSIEDDSSDAQVIISTKDVNLEEFQEGLRHFYSAHLLQNARGLYCVASYLDTQKILDYTTLFDDFALWWRGNPDLKISLVLEQAVRSIGCYDLGLLIHYALDAYREDFTELIDKFICSRSFCADERIRFLCALDRVLMPYVYSSTPMTSAKSSDLMGVVQVGERQYEISVPDRMKETFGQVCVMSGWQTETDSCRYRIDHARGQYPFMKLEGLEHNAAYCHGMILRRSNILPVCTPA